MRKTPLTKVFYFLPGNGTRKKLVASDGGQLMTSLLGTPRGRCDEYSSKIFPQLRNQGLSFLERREK
jgi:hypothetical protein